MLNVRRATARLDIPLPEITFGNNVVSLKRLGKRRAVEDPSQPAEGSSSEALHIVFDGLHALAEVDTTGQDTIKVSYADAWAKSRRLDAASGSSDIANGGNTSVIETVKNYDWTYSTTYAGTLGGKEVSSSNCAQLLTAQLLTIVFFCADSFFA